MPERIVSAHHEQFLATVVVTGNTDPVGGPDARGWLTEAPPIAPPAVWGGLPDLPAVSVSGTGKNFLPAVLIPTHCECVSDWNVVGRSTQPLPIAPTTIWCGLPFLPQRVVAGVRENLLSAILIASYREG